MSYHDLSECTLSNEERRDEARKIVNLLVADGIFNKEISDSERRFLSTVGNLIYVSVKQLFWLRDIKDKYL